MLRAILFDLGDTLLDFEPMDTRAVFERGARTTYDYLKRKGCRLPSFEHYCRRQYSAVRWRYLWSKLTGREFNGYRLLKRLADQYRFQDHEASLNRLAWLWYQPLVEHASIEPELLSTLSVLASRGFKMGVVSNTFVPADVLDRHLRLTRLLRFFPVRIYSSEVGVRKPDRRIFEIALQRMRVEPNETLFVGDIVKTDIRGARRAGMRTALKQPWCAGHDRLTSDHVISRIADLLDLVGEGPGRTPVDASVASPKSELATFPLRRDPIAQLLNRIE